MVAQCSSREEEVEEGRKGKDGELSALPKLTRKSAEETGAIKLWKAKAKAGRDNQVSEYDILERMRTNRNNQEKPTEIKAFASYELR